MKLNSIEQIEALQTELTQTIDEHTKGVKVCSTLISNLTFFRREAITQPDICLIEPSIILVTQGKKQMLLGSESYAYDHHHFLITSLDLPASNQVIEASPMHPCLRLVLKIDLRVMTELITHSQLKPPNEYFTDRGMGIGTIEFSFLEPFKRLLELLKEPDAVEILAPLIEKEIYYRLLKSDQAERLWEIASIGSQSQRISKAINWLKLNYSKKLRIDSLAEYVQMSTSTFHHHFRKFTAMSPLQYQKWLRLNEAKRLMLNESLDAATAAFRVGYESPSQFSREYNRLFGSSPKRNIVKLRNQVNNAN